MELVWLEDFVALAETLSFSRAAEKRCVTQPAFSRRIRALEAWVGAPLFARTTHAVALTPAGAYFRTQADVLTRSVHQLRRDTYELANDGARGLTIASTHALSFTFFPSWVRKYSEVLSRGHLNLVSDSLQACEQMMVRGEAQFLLCHTHDRMGLRLPPAQFASLKVGSDRLSPLCAPGINGAARWPLSVRSPAMHLGYSAQSGLGRILATWLATQARPPALQTVFTSHLAATLLPMARAGDGVAWLPRTLASDDVAAGRLVDAGDAKYGIGIDIAVFRPVAQQTAQAEAVWAAFNAS